MYGPLNKLCGFECQRANLNFLRPFFVANCDDLLHIIVRYTWLCSSRGILKTNNGREGVKCKLFCPRGFRNRVARPLTTSAKKATHFWHPLYYSGAEKNRRHWPAHLGTWLRQKKVSQDEGQQNGNCEQAATANIIFRLAAVENSHLLCLPSMGRRSTDLEQPIRDWQNICIIATQNDLIDLIGDFEYTMYDLLVEELLQESDAEYQTVVQNILDEPVAEERKRRLFSALLLKAYQPISGPWD